MFKGKDEDVNVSRRDFNAKALQSLISFSALMTVTGLPISKSLAKPSSVSKDPFPAISEFFKQVNQHCRDVKAGKITQVQWQEMHEKLLSKVDIEDLMKYINLEEMLRKPEDYYFAGTRLYGVGKVKGKGKPFERDLPPGIPEIIQSRVEGFGDLIPLTSVFVFGLHGKDRYGVIPHAHDDSVSSHLVLKGKWHVRHYDRIKTEKDHYLITAPTVEEEGGPGTYSTISDQKNNIHWLTTEDKFSMLLNVHLWRVTDDPSAAVRAYLDPRGEKIDGGLIRAPKISEEEGYQRFAKGSIRIA